MPERASPAVVFIHGIGGSAHMWAAQIKTFATARLQALAVDLPGYGGGPPVRSMDFDGVAEHVERCIAERGLVKPVLIGHSMGGMVAQTMLRRRSAAYAAAVLACTSAAFGNTDGAFQRQFVADRLGPLDAGKTMADLAPMLVDRMMVKHADPSARSFAVAVMSKVPGETYRAAVRCLVTFDERENLSKIAVPVLCLAGDKDPNAPPAVVERMASKIRGCRYVCLEGAGHLPNLEVPSAFDGAILSFLQELRNNAPAGLGTT